jgi:NhaP-type Na+/H+ and K+/H+ antiporter
MAGTHEFILVAGALCLVATFAGLISARIGTPLLLVFIAIGMLAGEDGPGGIRYDDFSSAYFVGSLALVAILFEGGLSTERGMIRKAFWPSLALATVGVAISAGIIALAVKFLLDMSWPHALLIAAATAPTDAAAVSITLRLARVEVPERVVAALEIESGLNDPMSVFLTVGIVEVLSHPEALTAGHAGLLLLQEMGGGVVIGAAAGYALLWLFRTLTLERALFPVLAVGAALAAFGAAQTLGASGFLAVYLAGVIVGNHEHQAEQPVKRFFGTLGWLAQIALFLMLGLLVTPHDLPSLIAPAIIVSALLIVLARPAAVASCLLPFGWSAPEIAFVAWAGLRGAVPIYLTVIPLLHGVEGSQTLFNIVFVVVIASVALQGTTLSVASRVLRLRADGPVHA